MQISYKVITLKRTPERLEGFREANRRLDIVPEVVHGVDGSSIYRSMLVSSKLIARDLDWTDGALGNALSHRAIWLECIDKDAPVAVFEDDAHILPSVDREVRRIIGELSGWDIVFLGSNTDSNLEIRLFSGMSIFGRFSLPFPSREQIAAFLDEDVARRPVRVATVFGHCGYVISPAGARKALAHCFPLRSDVRTIPGLKREVRAQTMDTLLNFRLREFSAYAVIPPIVLTQNEHANSTTIRRGR